MLTRSVTLAILLSMALVAPGLAQQSKQASPQEKQAAEKVRSTYVQSYNSKDAKGIVDLYADDAVIVRAAPDVLEGKQAIEKWVMQDFKDGWSNLATQITDVRPLGSNLILVIGTWEALPPPAPATASATPSGQATSQPQSGTSQAPQKMHGLWSAVEQVQGTEAKIRNLTANIIMDQPAAANR
jgi:uncharacterized protein (TIGR02246 family)